MLKKTFAVALSLCLIIGLCGCGELQQNAPSSSEKDQSSQITSSAEKDDKEDEKDNNNKKDPLMTKDYTNPAIYTLDTLVSMGLESPRKSDKAIDKAADKMLKTIEARPDTLKPKAGGKYIYVANLDCRRYDSVYSRSALPSPHLVTSSAQQLCRSPRTVR